MPTALIVVDVQQDFCEGGSLAVAGGAAVAQRISDLIDSSGAEYQTIVATRDWHIDPGSHFAPRGSDPDYERSWPVHCVAGTPGARWHPNLRLPDTTLVISKGEHQGAYSGFEGHDNEGRPLEQALVEAGVDSVDIAGIATSYCVKATALDAARLGFRTRVLTGLVADVDPSVTPRTYAELSGAGVRTA